MRRYSSVICTAFAFGAFGLSSACSSTQSGDKLEPLRRSVKAYNEAYRWKNFERAASFLPRELRAAFIAAYEEDEKSLHVEDYQIVDVKTRGDSAADVDVRLTYIMLPSVVVQKRRMLQHWQKIGERWVLETEENSIRELDPADEPRNPEAFGGGYEPGEVEQGDTKVQVTDPEGNVVRDDAKTGPSVSPPPPR